jgi:hypothetical protein
MLAYRANESAFKAIDETVQSYLDHWFGIVDSGVSGAAIGEVTAEELAARDGRNKAIIFSPEVDKVWNQITPLVGEEASLQIRQTLAQVSK